MPIFVTVSLFFGMLFCTLIVANPGYKNHNKHGDRFPPTTMNMSQNILENGVQNGNE